MARRRRLPRRDSRGRFRPAGSVANGKSGGYRRRRSAKRQKRRRKRRAAPSKAAGFFR